MINALDVIHDDTNDTYDMNRNDHVALWLIVKPIRIKSTLPSAQSLQR